MTIRSMQIQDFLEIMARNADIYPEFTHLPDEQKRLLAHLNICTGAAESFYNDDGKLFAVGGIRYVGLGEAWMISIPEHRTPILLRQTSRNFERILHDKHLWRVFATTRLSEGFLKHLGFIKDESIWTWTRM